MDLKTPLYSIHEKHGGKIVSFAGYLLPVQYQTGLIKEHMAVREKAGIFDVSHMSEILFEGEDALANIQLIFSNDFSTMVDGQVHYTVMMNDNGGIIDDMVIYRVNENKYMVVANAANREKDYRWMKKHAYGNVQVVDLSDNYGQIALQGPKSKEILLKLTGEDNLPVKYYSFINEAVVAGVPCTISQTGYTGEEGYELYMAPGDAVNIWEALIEAGEEFGLLPCGLGARDTLRLEAAMPLYGHEMNDDIDPMEAGLKFAVKMKKENFIGKAALVDKGEPQKIRVGIKITGKGIAREENKIFAESKEIGMTTSGTHCPYLGYPIAMGYVDKEFSQLGTKLAIEVRGRMIEAEIISLPFYKKSK